MLYYFYKLRASLAAREQALITEMSQLHKAKSFTLTEQCDLLRTFQACLLSAVDRAVTAIQSAGDVQLLVVKSDIATTLEAMESQQPVLHPQADAALEFVVDDKRLLGELAKAGNVTDKSTYASTTSVFGSGLEKAYPGHESSFVITARDRQGNPCAVGGDPFVVELQRNKGEKVEVKLVDRRNGTYSATYVLPEDSTGELQLSVLLHGIQIQGSPFRVQTGVLCFIGFAQWFQNGQPYDEQWRLMDEACVALPKAPPGSRAGTWREYVEGKIKGLPEFAPRNFVFFTGPGSEGSKFEHAYCMKGVAPNRPLDGTFSHDNLFQNSGIAICVAYL